QPRPSRPSSVSPPSPRDERGLSRGSSSLLTDRGSCLRRGPPENLGALTRRPNLGSPGFFLSGATRRSRAPGAVDLSVVERTIAELDLHRRVEAGVARK